MGYSSDRKRHNHGTLALLESSVWHQTSRETSAPVSNSVAHHCQNVVGRNLNARTVASLETLNMEVHLWIPNETMAASGEANSGLALSTWT